MTGARKISLKVAPGRLRLAIRKIIFTERHVKHWTRLAWKAMESPPQNVLKICADVALGVLV